MSRERKRCWPMIVAAGLWGAAALITAGARADEALVPDGPPPDLFLVYTGDVIGYVDPCG